MDFRLVGILWLLWNPGIPKENPAKLVGFPTILPDSGGRNPVIIIHGFSEKSVYYFGDRYSRSPKQEVRNPVAADFSTSYIYGSTLPFHVDP